MSRIIQTKRSLLNFDPIGLNYVRFCVANETILVTYVKDEYVYISISFDRGVNFLYPEKVLKLKGELADIQVSAKDSQFVLAIKEMVSGIGHKRAVTGWMFPEGGNFRFKECTETESAGEIINVSLGFREVEVGKEESVDYVFCLNEQKRVTMVETGHG